MTDRERARAAADAELTRWERQLVDELARFWNRQEAVVLARLQGTKARKHTRHWEPPGESKIDPFYVVDRTRWVLDAVGSLTPLADRLYGEVYERFATKAGRAETVESARGRLAAVAGAAVDRIVRGIAAAMDDVHETIEQAEDEGFPMDVVARMVREQYRDKSGIWAQRIAGLNVVGMVNEASLLASIDLGSTHKQWLSFHDGRTRPTHLEADGDVQSIGDRFQVGAASLLYPGDPTGPLEEIANCRCTLLFSEPDD